MTGFVPLISSSSNAKTGSSSTAVTPSFLRYGTLSMTPRYVPACVAPEVGDLVKPRTCIS